METLYWTVKRNPWIVMTTGLLVFAMHVNAQPFCYTPPPMTSCQCVEFSILIIPGVEDDMFTLNLYAQDVSVNPPAGPPGTGGSAASVTSLNLYLFFNSSIVQVNSTSIPACFNGAGWATSSTGVFANTSGFFSGFDSYYRYQNTDGFDVGCLVATSNTPVLTIEFTALSNGTAAFHLASTDPAGFTAPEYSTLWASGNFVCTGIGDLTILPLRLLSFDVELNDKFTSELTWTTTDQINSGHFAIERSFDGITWETIDEVQAVHSTDQILQYKYVDETIMQHSNTNHVFYKLKIVDQDGSFTYSGMEALVLRSSGSISVSPKPATTDLTVEWLSSQASSIVLYDLMGRPVYRQTIAHDEMRAQIDLSDLPLTSGVYLLQLEHNGVVIDRERVVIQLN